jgi:DNA-directed RNA polymerase specialized sigma24 family protein
VAGCSWSLAFANLDVELTMPSGLPDPENLAVAGELSGLVNKALLALPEQYRMVIMLRDVEELSTSEAAAVFEIH